MTSKATKAEVSEAKAEFLEEIWEIIKTEFPYTSLTEQDFLEKLESERAWVFSIGEKKLEAFSELEEMIPGKLGRVNAVFVKQEFRRRGLGTKLLEHAIRFFSERGIRRIILVVAGPNTAGKKLYKKCGFVFKKKMQNKVGGMKAEEWEMELP